MHSSAPDLDAHVCEAFDEACLAIFNTRVERPLRARTTHLFLLRFAEHYQHLSTLPRRVRRSMQRQWKRTLSAIALLMALGQAPALAATIQVSAATPPAIKADGKCSLIEAIVNANRDARPHLDCVAGLGADTIVLPANGQQLLNGTDMLPQITSRIVIEGHGSTVSRNTNSDLTFFSVGSSGNLALNETTVSGAVAGVASSGYGVSNAGRLTLNRSALAQTGGLFNSGGSAVLNDSSITDSRGAPLIYSGAGIQNRDGGSVFATNSVIARNTGYLEGGGIFNDTGSSVTLTDSIVSQNATGADYSSKGGGIFNRGTLVLVGTTVAENRASDGAGIVNVGTATVRRSTISGNRLFNDYQYGQGGGIYNAGELTLVNSTVSNNAAWRRGGGVVSRGTLAILSSTVTGNRLMPVGDLGYSQMGGGVWVSGGTLTLKRSIVSGNSVERSMVPGGNPAFYMPEVGVYSGVTVAANDFNLFGHDGEAGVGGFTPGSSDIVPNKGIRGILLPLADNGGGTKTHALAIGSPALDTSPDDATCPATDQRGNPRPRGPACDSGAFEGVAVMCNGRVTTMVGTINDDHLTGTAGPDVISGLTGNDTVSGLAGDDLVCAGSGADVVYGGSGRDQLFGEPGNDRLLGQGENDTLNGGVDQDICTGGSGAGDTATACETVNSVP